MTMKIAGKKMLLGGQWEDRENKIKVYNPENNDWIDSVPAATKEDAIKAIKIANQGRKIAEQLTVYERMNILNQASDYIEKHHEEYSSLIALEGVKTIKEARKETTRAIETLRLSAEEARRLTGETIPFDQMPGNNGRFGYYYRFPIGVIVAITPYNDPLNLVAHKLGPAIASGNAIILKPATETPLSALKMAEAFVHAGLPEKVLTVITGRSRDIGDVLIESKEVHMISFTGGLATGEEISKKAGIKKLSMELGSNSPAIVRKDADLPHAARAICSGAFSAAGQNCLSVQRIYVEEDVYSVFKEKLLKETAQLRLGSKLSEETDIGPLINEQEAEKVEAWVNEAVEKGANVLIGGMRDKTTYTPTILEDVPKEATIHDEEVFGPVAMLFPVKNLEEAIQRANDVNYGLHAGIFTRDMESAFQVAHSLQVGGVMVNDSSDVRIDAMPFGGVKGSGLGREGVKYAMRDMSEEKVVSFQLSNES